MLQEQAESRNRHDKCVTDRFFWKALYQLLGALFIFAVVLAATYLTNQMDGRYAAWTPE